MSRKRTLEASDKAVRALELRRQGHSYSEIATKLGYYDKSSAHKAVQKALSRHESESVKELRTLQQLQYDDLFRKLWAELLDNEGNIRLPVVDRLLTLLDNEAKLHGLYAYSKCPNCQPYRFKGAKVVILQ